MVFPSQLCIVIPLQGLVPNFTRHLLQWVCTARLISFDRRGLTNKTSFRSCQEPRTFNDILNLYSHGLILCSAQYWKRDARRKYPQLSVVTQPELTQLLLGESAQPAYVLSCTKRTHLTLRETFLFLALPQETNRPSQLRLQTFQILPPLLQPSHLPSRPIRRTSYLPHLRPSINGGRLDRQTRPMIRTRIGRWLYMAGAPSRFVLDVL